MSTTADQVVTEFFDQLTYVTPVPVPLATVDSKDIAGKVPSGSSPWWIARLLAEKASREARLVRLRQYYRGEQDTWKLTSEGARLAFGRTFSGMKSNLAAPIVDAVAQRLKVEGFRVPVLDATDVIATAESDTEAWRIWQANGLDGRSMIAHTEALAMGECPVIVGRDPGDPSTPLITVEDPMQVVVERDPANARKRLAALKCWTETDGSEVLILYLPDRIEWWRAEKRSRISGYRGVSDTSFELRHQRWDLVPERSGAPPVPGEIPVVLLLNRPRVDGRGQGEHESVLPLIDAVNKTILDMLTTSEFTAYPQRTAVGVSLDDEDEDESAEGDVAGARLKAAPYRVWSSDNPDARFDQLAAAALSPYTDAIACFVENIGTVSGTPYHLLLNAPTSVPATGEALKSAERSLDAKVERDQVDIGEGWEEVMRLAFLTAGDTARATTRSEVRWRTPNTSNESQHADALVKYASLGLDFETVLEMIPFSPEQIARIKARKAAVPEATPPADAIAPPMMPAGMLPVTVQKPTA